LKSSGLAEGILYPVKQAPIFTGLFPFVTPVIGVICFTLIFASTVLPERAGQLSEQVPLM
jgi:hypothetical protein